MNRFIGRPLSLLFSTIDQFLVEFVGRFAGATIQSIFWRYVYFLGILFSGVYFAWALPQPYALGSFVFSTLVIFSVLRRWQHAEGDRALFVQVTDTRKAQYRILKMDGHDQDLRDEALTGFAVFLWMLLPIAMHQYDASFGGFANTEGASWWDWLGYLGGELTKAVPFIDWAEVYSVENGSPISPESGSAESLVFGVRTLFDLLLIAALVQCIDIMGRLAQQRELFDDGHLNVLDPFMEIELFSLADKFDLQYRGFRHYKKERLIEILAGSEDQSVTENKQASVRAAAAIILGNPENKTDALLEKIQDALIGALGDRDGFVRWSAASSLRQLMDDRVRETLDELIDEPKVSRTVKEAARLAKAQPDAKTLDLIFEMIRNDDWRSIVEATRTIGHLGFEGLIPEKYIKPASEEIFRLFDRRREELRAAAALALGNMGNGRSIMPEDRDRAVDLMLQQFSIKQETRVHAAIATGLGMLGRVVPSKRRAEVIKSVLFESLQSKYALLRSAASDALGNFTKWTPKELRDETTVKLLKLLDDKDFSVRGSSAIALGKLPSYFFLRSPQQAEIVSRLLELIFDQSEYVCRSAVRALSETGRHIPSDLFEEVVSKLFEFGLVDKRSRLSVIAAALGDIHTDLERKGGLPRSFLDPILPVLFNNISESIQYGGTSILIGLADMGEYLSEEQQSALLFELIDILKSDREYLHRGAMIAIQNMSVRESIPKKDKEAVVAQILSVYHEHLEESMRAFAANIIAIINYELPEGQWNEIVAEIGNYIVGVETTTRRSALFTIEILAKAEVFPDSQGDRIITKILSLFENKLERARDYGARCLAALAASKAIPENRYREMRTLVFEIIEDEHEFVRGLATIVLVRFLIIGIIDLRRSDDIISILLQLTADYDENPRGYAATALGEMFEAGLLVEQRVDEVTHALESLLKNDPDPDVRERASDALDTVQGRYPSSSQVRVRRSENIIRLRPFADLLGDNGRERFLPNVDLSILGR
jgi:HEAT repeat protein